MLRSFNPKAAALRAERLEADMARAKASRRAALMAGVGRMAHMGPAPTKAAPKDIPARNPALLALAKGSPCLLLAVDHCHQLRYHTSTTVACHRNEGKGMASKVSDAYSVWGCAACHEWYDRSGAPRAEKRRAFMAAHVRQLDAWRLLATDHTIPARERAAAQWALDQLNATPVVGLDDAP